MSRRALSVIATVWLAAWVGLPCALAGTTTLYRTVDANGVVQYSDTPSPGAQKVSVGSPNSSASPAPTYSSPQSKSPVAPAADTYRPICDIAEPKPEQVYFDTQSVAVTLHIEPAPQPGLRTVLTFDGNDIEGTGPSFMLNPVDRGAHTVTAVVHDAAGGVACETPNVTFYVRDASLLQSTHGNGQAAPAAPGVPVAPGVPHN